GWSAISNRSMVTQSSVDADCLVPVTRTRIVCVPEVSRGLVHTETSPTRVAEYSSMSVSAPPSTETAAIPCLEAVTACSVTREPSGMARLVVPAPMTVPASWLRYAVHVRPTDVLLKSSLNTVTLRVTVLLQG